MSEEGIRVPRPGGGPDVVLGPDGRVTTEWLQAVRDAELADAERLPKRCHWDNCPHGENCVHAR